MVSQYDQDNRRVNVYDRYGDSLGVFVLKHGGWDFITDEYRRERVLSTSESAEIERMQSELNT